MTIIYRSKTVQVHKGQNGTEEMSDDGVGGTAGGAHQCADGVGMCMVCA